MASFAELLAQTWPARLGQSIWGALTLPGDVYAGRVDPMSDEGIGRAADLAGMTMGGTYGGAPRGALGSGFADPLYHGSSKAGLQELTPSTRGALGPGVYTTPAPQVAERYAWNDVPVYQLPEKTRDIYRGHGHRTDAEWYGFKEDKSRLLKAAEPEYHAQLKDILDKAWSNTGYENYGQISRMYGGGRFNEDAAQALYKRAGFEGLSGLVDGPEVLLFDPQRLMPYGLVPK